MDQKQELTVELTSLVGNKGFVFQINRAAQSYTPIRFPGNLKLTASLSPAQFEKHSRVAWTKPPGLQAQLP